MSTYPPADPANFHRMPHGNTTTIAVGTRLIHIPHHPTVTWLGHLADQALHHIFPGMLNPHDQHWIFQLLADPATTFDVPDVHRIARNITADITALPWYVSARLANSAGRYWLLADGAALLRGVDLLAYPIRRTLAVIYGMNREGCKDDDERAMFDRELWATPEGEKPQWTPTQQASSFAAFRAMQAALGASPNPQGSN